MQENKSFDELVLHDIVALDDSESYKSVMYEEIAGPDGNPLFKKVAGNTTTLSGTDILGDLFIGMYPGASATEVARTSTAFSKMDVDLQNSRGVVFPASNDAGVHQVIGVVFGLDGSIGATDILPVERHKDNYDVSKLIPIRKIPIANDDAVANAPTYKIRGVAGGGSYAEYYLKVPTTVEKRNMTKSGMVLTSNPNGMTINEDVVTVVTITVNIAAIDMAEYFALNDDGDVNLRRFNSAMIVYGDRVTTSASGMAYTDFRNIRVTNRFNLPNRALGKYGTGKYIFNIYFK